MLLLLWVTSGPIKAYQDYLFSLHMVGHMLLTMAIPLLLVPGAPVTLAARAIARRDDGTRGGREWNLWAVHRPLGRVLTNHYGPLEIGRASWRDRGVQVGTDVVGDVK